LKLAATFLLLVLLSGCAGRTHQQQSPREADGMLQDGIHALSKKKTAPLQQLINQYPDTPQGRAAAQLLKTYNKQCLTPDAIELEKLRQENLQLKADLEKLRQLLIKSEKRAS